MTKAETKHNACFVAGTLVHTDKGLVPIEQIKVGDMVLSRHESGEGEATYKRVTNTFITENQPIYAIHLVGNDLEEFILTTNNHPFWQHEIEKESVNLEKGNWTNSIDIHPYAPLSAKNGNVTLCYLVLPLTQSNEKNQAFYPIFYQYGLPTGYFLDINEYKTKYGLVPLDWEYEDACQSEEANLDEFGYQIEAPYLDTVYNIEVEDYHTYYVGKTETWVHNDNCGRTRLERLVEDLGLKVGIFGID